MLRRIVATVLILILIVGSTILLSKKDKRNRVGTITQIRWQLSVNGDIVTLTNSVDLGRASSWLKLKSGLRNFSNPSPNCKLIITYRSGISETLMVSSVLPLPPRMTTSDRENSYHPSKCY